VLLPRVHLYFPFVHAYEAYEPSSNSQIWAENEYLQNSSAQKRSNPSRLSSSCYNDSMTRGKALVDEDVIRIAELLGFGYSTHDIGKKLGMPQRTVSYRMAKYGLKSCYRPHVQKKKAEEHKEDE